jgi:hypothetical protein
MRRRGIWKQKTRLDHPVIPDTPVIPAKAGISILVFQIRSFFDKSSQSGLVFSIKLIFHCLFHFFNCFSRVRQPNTGQKKYF